MEYYDELTVVTNKIVMSYNPDTPTILNKEVRDDALHAFMTGLKKKTSRLRCVTENIT